MKRTLFYIVAFTSLLLSQKVVSIRIDGTINPAAAEYLHRGIEKAEGLHAQALLVHLNTPGGLLKSTRVMVSDILESDVPVVVYVSPGGAHAGSAGVFVTLAAHVAAMAPGTNIGAAHPVDMQGKMDSVMNEKATNDAAAFIRTIAEKRKRNVAWAEEAVRQSLSITESEALKKGVIDFVAKNEQELLKLIDGKEFEVRTRVAKLETASAEIIPYEMDATERILDLLSDPNVAYILFLLGVYGLMFELYNPGAILPGVVGVISIILAFYSMHTLPVNYAGLALIVVAIVLFILEIKIVSHGLLAASGVVSLILGSMMLIRSDSGLEFAQVSFSVILTGTAVTAGFFLFVIGLGLKAQRAKPVTGIEGTIGEMAQTISALDPNGTVKFRGEIWNAESVSGKIAKGTSVLVKEIRNLTLIVEKQ